MIRPQYHLRPSAEGLLAWDVRRLIMLSGDLPVCQVKVSEIAELDESHWDFQAGAVPTCRSVVEHCALRSAGPASWVSAGGRP